MRRNRWPDGTFQRIYKDEQLNKWIELRWTPAKHADMVRLAADRGDTLSGLLRAAVDADEHLSEEFSGLDGRRRLYAAMKGYWKRYSSKRTFFRSLRVTPRQLQLIQERAERMKIRPRIYVDAAAAFYLYDDLCNGGIENG